MSFASLALLLPFGLQAAAVAIPAEQPVTRQFSASFATAQTSQGVTPLEVTPHYATLQRSEGPSKHSPLLAALRDYDGPLEGRFTINVTDGQRSSTTVDKGHLYLTTMEWSGAQVSVVMDTASSDTWLVQTGFTCVDPRGNPQSESACAFGPSFSSPFGGGQLQNEVFNVSYSNGEFVTGYMGYEQVTYGGLTVNQQEVALGNYAYWLGDNTASGVIGFAYPALTSAYFVTPSERQTYNPILTNLFNQGSISPVFSLALERQPGSGYVGLGGLPPIQFNQTFASTPIQMVHMQGESTSAFTFYAINVDGYGYPNTVAAASQAIVDSGTTVIYAPNNIAAAWNNAFSPPAQYVSDLGAYYVPCNAQAPPFGVTIAGTTFPINPVDLVLTRNPNPALGLCLSAVQNGGSGPYVLGDVFLQNVVAVFDVGAGQMRFAPHSQY